MELTYESALKKLQTIVKDLENDKVSVDKLEPKTKEAHELLLFCSEKLKSIRKKIEEIGDPGDMV